jgi:hypothetical protein
VQKRARSFSEREAFRIAFSDPCAVKDKARGVRVTLTCYNCREYGSCEKPQEVPIHLSKESTTIRTCLQELLKRLQENHGNCAEALKKKAAADTDSVATVSPDTPNMLQAMMQLRQDKSRAETAHKVVLEEEKKRDTDEKAMEELKRQIQPKRGLTDDDAGDPHEMLTEVDNWDLRDNRQQAT